ncbi:hypothetical protein FUA26_07105 [Seonamhaeicola algicola]|uniref:DUF3299 domain-containing protein n=1 Tax=Seonamhaeicola algicola TaxID=1719036 RepID=A0A5C7AZD8_9FLAO|nr:hypothetical protein [Seonamhaeicola algicola]TXE11825.1 hypothetical protein FUA26_07105 [Seonamhaeicola algicola]
MKNKILIGLLLTTCVSFSQTNITWNDLAKVTFEEKFLPAYDEAFLVPTFSNTLKALEGKYVTIKGYFLNIAPEEKIYILSKGPMSSCFFCGVGGPETAVELEFDNTQNFKTDNIVLVTGKLKLNAVDVDHFNYILTDCTLKLTQ